MRKVTNRPRRGGTLIELLVALLLLDLAILSLATVSALAARRIGDAGRLTRSSLAAASRVERLAAGPCGLSADGSVALERGVREQWSVRRFGGTAEIVDSIALQAPRELIVLRTRVPC